MLQMQRVVGGREHTERLASKQAERHRQLIIWDGFDPPCLRQTAGRVSSHRRTEAAPVSNFECRKNACGYARAGCPSARRLKAHEVHKEQLRKDAYLVQLVEDRLQLLRRVECLQPVHLGGKTAQKNEGFAIKLIAARGRAATPKDCLLRSGAGMW